MKYQLPLSLILTVILTISCNPIDYFKGLTQPKSNPVGNFSDNSRGDSCDPSQLSECVNDQVNSVSSGDCYDVVVDNHIPSEVTNKVQISAPSSGGGWTSEYTKWTLEGSNEIVQNNNLSDEDLEKLGCPGYKYASSEQRKLFWPYLLAALAKKESNYRPSTNYAECSNGTTWDPSSQTSKQAAELKGASSCWVSSGLFQLTRSTVENSPYSCSFKKEGWDAVLDPEDNIKCALKVLNQQIKTCGLFCKTSKAYFGPLKRDADSQDIQQHFKTMASSNLGLCKLQAPQDTDKIGQVQLETKCSRIQDSNATKTRAELPDEVPEIRTIAQ